MLGNLAEIRVGNFYVVFYFTTIKTFFFFFSKERNPFPPLPHPPQWTWVAPLSGPPYPQATLHWPLASSCLALPRCPPFRQSFRVSSSLDLLSHPLTTLTQVTLQLPEDLPRWGLLPASAPPTPQLPLSPT